MRLIFSKSQCNDVVEISNHIRVKYLNARVQYVLNNASHVILCSRGVNFRRYLKRVYIFSSKRLYDMQSCLPSIMG